jgi:hypothetical protein
MVVQAWISNRRLAMVYGSVKVYHGDVPHCSVQFLHANTNTTNNTLCDSVPQRFEWITLSALSWRGVVFSHGFSFSSFPFCENCLLLALFPSRALCRAVLGHFFSDCAFCDMKTMMRDGSERTKWIEWDRVGSGCRGD